MARATASQERQLQYITVDDFSPGIWTASAYGPLGAAAGASGCTCDQNKALVAGPGSFGSPITKNFGDGFTPTGAVSILSMRVMSNLLPVDTGSASGPNVGAPSDQVFIMYQWWSRNGGGPGTAWHQKMAYETYKTWDSNFPYSISTNDQVTTLTPDFWADAPFIYGFGGIDISRANNASPTSLGSVVVGSVYMASATMAAAIKLAYPAQGTPDVDSSAAMTFSGTRLSNILAHQDRFVALRGPSNSKSIVNATVWPSSPSWPIVNTGYNEVLDFTANNNYAGTANTLLIGEENPMGYGTWCSMNANQLFLVKQAGGAVSVTGPLENPTVTKLPGVESTKGTTSQACVLPNGSVVYGTVSGIHAWSGGDTSQQLSAQLADGWFWNTTPFSLEGETFLPYLNSQGRFAYQHPFVYCPGNFLYDTRFNGWWTLAATEPVITWWDNGGTNFVAGLDEGIPLMWGSPISVAATTDANVAQHFANGHAADFTWQSKPLPITQGRTIAVREVRITYSSPGSLTIALASRTNTQAPITLPSSGGGIRTYTVPVECDGDDVTFTLQTTGNTGVTTKVIRVSLGYHERQTAR